MARRAAKCTVGIQDDGQNTDGRNTLLTSIWDLAKIGPTSFRVENHGKNKNDEAMCPQLDLVDEIRATAKQRLARYQNLMAKHYNSIVRHRDFQVGDLILRKVMGATRDPSQGKLGPT